MNKELETGTTLSHYRIVSKIGAGGMGEVYLADDTKLERQVALKILLPDVASDDERVRRFVQEAKAASALNHPNILTVFEVGSSDGLRYIATELIRGKTLRDRMRSDPLKLSEALEITLQVAAALGAAHEAGIIHRDIKPENIMIRDDGLIKVLDFGLAKLSGMAAESVDTTLPQFSTNPGTLVGTVAYMSPEQARGRKLDPRSDIFSLGIVMFELFTGKRPFDGEGHLDLISSILKDEPLALRQVSPGLPRHLERIVEKTLRKDRNHRYQHVRDLHIDIEDLRDELRFEAKLNQTVQPTLAGEAMATSPSELRSAFTTGLSKTRRFTLLHALIFVLVVTCAAGSAWYFRLIGPSSTAVAPGSYKVSEVASWNSAPGELFSSAKFSPDGKLIAFASTKSGSKNIWVTQTGSTEALQITNDAFANTEPIWSPKGDEIAYFSDRGANSTGVWRVSALGGTPKLIGPLGTRNVDIRRWTASGKIYYESGSELYSMDLSSGAAQKITSFENEKASLINISPDEKSLIYVSTNQDGWRILERPVSAEKTTEILHGPGKINGLVWLPNKNRVFYGTEVEGVVQVFVCRIGSGQSSRITASETDSTVVDATADGRSILTSLAKEDSNIWRVNIADGQEIPIARDLNVKIWPVVSPDNSRIAFQSARNMSQGSKIWDSTITVKTVKQRDDGEKPAIIAEHASLPRWSADGASLAYVRDIDGKKELFVKSSSGGGERKLLTGSLVSINYSVSPYNYFETLNFAWSPDNLEIVYVTKKDGLSNIRVVSVKDNSDNPITENNDPGAIYYSPTWFADGSKIALSYRMAGKSQGEKARFGLGIIGVGSPEILRVYENTKNIRFLGLTNDGLEMIFAETAILNAAPCNVVLKKVAIAGGTEKTIADLQNTYYFNMFLADDQKTIAFAARNDEKDDLWVIPVAGGQAKKVTSNNDSGVYYSRLAWFHDGSAITFGKQTRFSLLSLTSDID